MSNGAPIRTGIIGFGLAGRVFHAPFLATNPAFTIAAIATSNEERAAQAAAAHPGAQIVSTDALLALVGRSDDLTGRLDIWSAVVELAQQRPWFGWGWVSYWAPWVEPFDDLVVIRGVTYLQAHNAWLDVWLQLGIVGLVLVSVLVLATTVRTVSWAVNFPRGDVVDPAALRLAPVLVLAMLLVHSLAESRLLIEAGLLLLVWMWTGAPLGPGHEMLFIEPLAAA